MPRTDVTIGTYVEFCECIHRVTELYCTDNNPLTPLAKLVEINVDENGKVTEGNTVDSGVVAYALQPVVYPTVVLQLAIHDRQQELDDQVRRAAELRREIESLKLALGIIQRNEAINGDPDD